MCFDTADLSMLMHRSGRLSHGVPCSSVLSIVPILIQNVLTSVLVSALAPSVTKASGTLTSLDK